jgi:ribosomal protein S18 acetylase RimI-like enzyme
MNIDIRTATEADIAGIAGIHMESIRQLAAIVPKGFGKAILSAPTQDWLEEHFREGLNDPACLLAVAEAEGELLGFVSAWVEDSDEDLVSAPYMTIEFVESRPAVQGQGIATALFGFAEERAREHGVTTMDLIVWETNPRAAALYERLGYSCIERRMAKLL